MYIKKKMTQNEKKLTLGNYVYVYVVQNNQRKKLRNKNIGQTFIRSKTLKFSWSKKKRKKVKAANLFFENSFFRSSSLSLSLYVSHALLFLL